MCRVLFVGDSLTYVNELPAIFIKLARSGHHLVEAGIDAKPDEDLARHIASRDIEQAFALRKWSVVVLQEQSAIPAVPRLQREYMYPAIRRLVTMSRHAGALPILFETWAHREGWPAQGLIGYTSMQTAVDSGYAAVARESHVGIAPVGHAWAAALRRKPLARLWRADGLHPTIEGTYLAACVFYASVFGESPERLPYRAGLPVRTAAYLSEVAAQTVLSDPRP